MYSVLLKKENAHTDAIYCCAWAVMRTCGDTRFERPDHLSLITKEYVVTGGLDSLIKLWRVINNKLDLKYTLRGHMMAVESLAVSPDGYTLASVSLDNTLLIWCLSSGEKIHEISIEHTDAWNVAFSPDGAYVVSSGLNGKITVYNVEKGTTEFAMDSRGKITLSVAWSEDGRYIASGAADGTVCIFDVPHQRLLHAVANSHTKDVKSVCFSPDSKQVVTGSHDGFLKVFDTASGNLQFSLDLASWTISAVSPSGLMVAAAYDRKVQLLNLGRFANVAPLAPLHMFNEHSKTITGISFNDTSEKLVSVSKDKSIVLYECKRLC